MHPPDEELAKYRRIRMKRALANKSSKGTALITKNKLDAIWAEKRKNRIRPAKLGKVAVGVRVAHEEGLPEWMSV
eukprot:6425171-Amphidinium_carterae.1